MPDPSDIEARVTALEARMEDVAADAAAARHLAAAGDRDLADLGIKVDANRRATDANRQAIEHLGVKVDANTRDIDVLAGKVDVLDGKVGVLNGKVEVLNGKVEVLNGKVEALDGKVEALDGKVDDLAIKVDANRQTINALGVQTAARFDRLEGEFHSGFAEMRAKLDQTAGGLAHIVALLTRPEHG